MRDGSLNNREGCVHALTRSNPLNNKKNAKLLHTNYETILRNKYSQEMEVYYG